MVLELKSRYPTIREYHHENVGSTTNNRIT